jgi:hypothetical protein
MRVVSLSCLSRDIVQITHRPTQVSGIFAKNVAATEPGRGIFDHKHSDATNGADRRCGELEQKAAGHVHRRMVVCIQTAQRKLHCMSRLRRANGCACPDCTNQQADKIELG